ncbi:MAG TPA: ABC transporter ATP-binding protein [Candidatus Hydrogenedentes bacterium]|nr:MAG: Zinc import ATP-binding protein ZnuC [Candidatus Hydrogenedentes bacterium ADurb.Bin170]HNZ47958.1 ABC transporter ATP-binding protein [Candidatus Hydrogenedentota bacterium]HOD94469.1 ABC transporter ATP-binding protein [Candidatus Hydrogenedentota bacterium]HOH43164.1 ABC transporter ATP-binding protein [Candidatus Hydrogenedentota bacterium]HOM48750.1 ABC transporter ATP-binding protein [Candidatus Hydrogenedentota bacterium]
MSTAIHIDRATVNYGSFCALENVTMQIRQGQLVTIVGPNGGGKSTLFKLILGLVRPVTGSVQVLGMPPGDARLSMGYVPQSSLFDPLFPVHVFDVARMGCLGAGNPGPFRKRKETRERVMNALEAVGLDGLANRWFSSLSGGQRQRTLIARALVSQPEVLLLDEPTSNVDIAAEDMILDILDKLKGKMTILLVTHYPQVAMRFLDHVYCVNRTVHIHPPTQRMDETLMRHITGMSPPNGSTEDAGGQNHA